MPAYRTAPRGAELPAGRGAGSVSGRSWRAAVSWGTEPRSGCAGDGACEQRRERRALRATHPIGIVTNGFELVQTRRLAASALHGWIDFLVTSEAAGAAKPARAVFDRALALAARPVSPERVLMVGDGLSSDIAGGRAMGFATCWYNPERKPPPGQMIVDYTIGDLRELLSLVARDGTRAGF